MTVSTATVTSAATASAAAGPNPYTTATFTNAVSVFSNSGSSLSDKINAYTIIEDAFKSHSPYTSSAPDLSSNTTFKQFVQQAGDAQDALYANLPQGDGTASQKAILNNFNNLSSGDQTIIASILGDASVTDYRSYLQTKANFLQTVDNAVAAAGVRNINQLQGSQFDSLKTVANATGDGVVNIVAWTAQAQQVVNAFQATQTAAPPPKDTVALSPAAQAVVSLTTAAPSDGASAVALKTLENATNAASKNSAAAKSSATSATASKAGVQKPYAPGSIQNTTA